MFNNLGLALGLALKFYKTVAKELKLKVKVFGANSYVSRSYREKTGRRPLVSPILIRVNELVSSNFVIFRRCCNNSLEFIESLLN